VSFATLLAAALSLGAASVEPATLAPADAEANAARTEADTVSISLLRGGTFGVPAPEDAAAPAWWRGLSGSWRLEDHDGVTWLVLEPGAALTQSLPWPPGVEARSLTLRGRAAGAAQVTWSSANGLGYDGAVSGAFELGGAELTGESATPRFALTLSVPADAGEPGRFAELAVDGALPAISRADLRAELLAELAAYFDLALEHATDDLGPRATPFIVRDFDLASGAPLAAPFPRVTLHPLYSELLEAWRCELRPEWEAALAHFLEVFLDEGAHPATGLPRFWDPLADQPRDLDPIEIRAHLNFLLDLAEFGPEALRARSTAAAVRIAQHVLDSGRLPDGNVAAQYVPATGEARTGTPPIRRLDVPAALARLGRLTGQGELRDVARDAVLEMEYAHWWPGTWQGIDPGFDDDYGHYGQRAAQMLEAWPEVPAFERLAVDGLEHYLPLWRDAVRFGGNVAADQVRCWEIAARLARLRPELRAPVAERLDEALHLHLLGEQTPDGRWIDVTVVDFRPQHLPVGDTAGAPQNLLYGLALALHPAALGAGTFRDPAEARAWFAALWRAEGRLGVGRPGSFVERLRVLPGTVQALVGLSADG
jgi:hypothetical protein